MFEADIVDPAKVTRAAVQNAALSAGMVLTTECIVVDKPEPPKAKSLAGAGMGGGDLTVESAGAEFEDVAIAVFLLFPTMSLTPIEIQLLESKVNGWRRLLRLRKPLRALLKLNQG